MLKRLSWFILCLFLSSCQVSSKTALSGDGGRNSYNYTLQQTNNEQMLLNLVRLRFLDFPYFLDVNNVTTQTTVGSKAFPLIPIPGFSKTNPAKLGGEFSWQNQPTIQYSPLEGTQFTEQLFHPLSLVLLQRLIYSGWEVDRVFRIMIQSLDNIQNAPSASGPAPDLAPSFKTFLRLTRLLRVLQRENELLLGVKAEKNGGIAGEDHTYSLQISFPEGYAESDELIHLFGEVDHKNGRHSLTIKHGFDEQAHYGVLPRSLLGCMYYLSLGVEVPQEMIQKGDVPYTKTRDGHNFNWEEMMDGLMTIKSSRTKPKRAAIVVRYRDYWYYIDECDLSSKRTFILLLQLYNFSSGTPRQSSTLLTLPLG